MPNWWQSLLRTLRPLRIINQIYSLGGARTENLRRWDRQDKDRKQLIVLVHGFNSGKDTAWGQLPSLLLDDPDFADFNLHRFGYPTSIIGQVTDIRDQGELLASLLREIIPSYRSTVLVGHSVGGLVILNALLSLEGQDRNVLIGTDIKILTFGTPFAGVQNASMLRMLGNAQANDVETLNKELYRLKQLWEQRFSKIAAESEQGITPQVALSAYYGTEDGFVLPASACAGPAKTCEPVDGDHNTIVKPIDREHLAYQKLRSKALGTTPKVAPTLQGRVGIWVARVIGDKDIRRAQGSIIENLRTHIARESELKSVVEIRELPEAITGFTDEEERIEAERLGKRYNAAILVWGRITGLLRHDEFHPRVMLVERIGIPSELVRLSPITESLHQQVKMSLPPGTVGLPAESIREPVQLARFVIAFTFLEQEKWIEAARHFNAFIEGGLSSALKIPDVYFYAGFANNHVHELTGNPESLQRAKEAYLNALIGHTQERSWGQYAAVQNNLGLTYRMLAGRGVESEQNLQLSIVVLQEASSRFADQGDCAGYALAQNNLGTTYGVLAERGVEPEKNLKLSLATLQEAAEHYTAKENWSGYALVQNNLGLAYRLLAGRGVEPEENLQLSVDAFKASAHRRDEDKDWAGYVLVKSNLGMAYGALAERGIDPQKNLQLSVAALEEAARYFKDQQNWAGCAVVNNNLGVTYGQLAGRGVEPGQNLQLSIKAYCEAARHHKDQQNWADYAGVQSNLGLAYRTLAERGVEPQKNLKLSLAALQEAAEHYTSQENWAGYARVQNNFGMAYGTLAGRGVGPQQNLELSVAALQEASHRFAGQENWAGYAQAQNNLGLAYRMLAGVGVEPEQNLYLSLKALQEADHHYTIQKNWPGHASAQNSLGITHGLLAGRGVEPEQNLQLSIDAYGEAARHYKDQENWAVYARAQNSLGMAYGTLAKQGVKPEENLELSISILQEASHHYANQKNWAGYAFAQYNLGVTHGLFAERGVDPEQNLQLSIAANQKAAHHFKSHQNWEAHANVQKNLELAYRLLAQRGVEPDQNLALANKAFREATEHH